MSTEPAAGTPQNPYRVCAPADILSLIPHTLGFEPRNSLVLLALCGNRLDATLRLDLPPARGLKPGTSAAYALNACRFMASDPRADGVLLAMYTDEPWIQPAHAPYRSLIRRMAKEFGAAGIPLQDGWLVGPDTWRNYFCVRPHCCPWPGTPRQQIADSMLNTELVYRGSAYASSLENAVGESFPPPWGNHEQVAEAQERFTALVGGQWNGKAQFRGTLLLWAKATETDGAGSGSADPGSADPGLAGSGDPAPAGGSAPAVATRLREDPELAGFLLASLQDRSVRDTLLVLGAAGAQAALAGAEANGLTSRQAQPPVFPAPALPSEPLHSEPLPSEPLRGTRARGTLAPVPFAGQDTGRAEGRPTAAADFRNILVGTSPTVPDWNMLDRTYAVFRDLVPVAAGDPKAALLCLLAWIEWARGRGSRSDVFLQHALDESPGYRLALLLRELLGTGVLPDWARSRAGSWPGEPG
ncbi:DUF4192 family protein [Arthrobacter sp. zg-Y1143]|uniref:DUF4192 family protein n=1 Tax=Arthrobacter sp. zg-Y1143 TaxID=3049065 RepID=UPI0024C449FC|nr:DUF4192 family protein [Arthrobacter sp. zg-Y1143]MDK1327429.1 DUF4192 family protein [Arthrobacter sp. zg-Y1143]